ncbi:MAG TPA: apolipoprotein N-acyltransferase [Microscillaceae bacterium]|nr:apolipoprotein N-acyltransferase [Microscillaceae bacterium]
MSHATSIPIKKISILALICIIALWLSWQVYPIFLLVGFVPILMIEAEIVPQKRGGLKFWLVCLLIMIGWNALTTWWLAMATVPGAIAAIILNALLMTLPFMCYRITRQALNNNYGYFTFVLYWLSFEYLHLHWDISWSWLTLGNAFAQTTTWVQWYEYTGVLGGSLWVLCLNLLGYFIVKSTLKHNRRLYAFYLGLLVLVPTVASLLIKPSFANVKRATVEVALVQPNIDPYTQKFRNNKDFIPYRVQLKQFIKQAKSVITPQTQILLFPETAFDEQYIEPQLSNYGVFRSINTFLSKNPQLSLMTGATTARFYGRSATTPTARLHTTLNKYYDVFNTAIWLRAQQKPAFYHKSKLVAGVETLPYPEIFSVLGAWLIDLGGTTGSYGTQKERSIFQTQDSTRVAPLICFESLHGGFTTEYVNKNAQLLTVITNDGWWGNTEGHRKHFAYTRLRAIETRRAIAFCANTGTSGFIDVTGEVLQKSAYNTPAVLKQRVPLSQKITIYVQYGDYIGRLAAFLAVGLLLTLFVKRITGGKTGMLQK